MTGLVVLAGGLLLLLAMISGCVALVAAFSSQSWSIVWAVVACGALAMSVTLFVNVIRHAQL